jgi:hypothetical protein
MAHAYPSDLRKRIVGFMERSGSRRGDSPESTQNRILLYGRVQGDGHESPGYLPAEPGTFA